jgi:hypothetical protein
VPTLPIPTPAEAAQLRAEFAGHRLVRAATDALYCFCTPDPETVAMVLPLWKRYPDMTQREALAVIAQFVVTSDPAEAAGEAPVDLAVVDVPVVTEVAGEPVVLSEPVPAAVPVEHRVIIGRDGNDYVLSCTGCSLKWRAPTLRAAEKTRREHQGTGR